MVCKSHVRKRSHASFHNGRQHDASTRPKQLRDREVPWEGSHRSKLMSRRTERPYKVDGAGELARHSAAWRSTPEIRTARNRRTRTRMYGGVGAGRGNPPGDPIRLLQCARG